MHSLRICVAASVVAGGVLALGGVLAASPASAQDDLSLRRGLIHCASLETPDARLVCFEALAAMVIPETTGMVGALVPKKPRTEAMVSPDVAEQAQKKQTFGADRVKQSTQSATTTEDGKPDTKKEKKPKGVTYNVVRATKDGEGRYILRMENGQIWRQIEPSYIRVPKDGAFEVRIVKGRFGDYKLRVGGKGRLSRVIRIK